MGNVLSRPKKEYTSVPTITPAELSPSKMPAATSTQPSSTISPPTTQPNPEDVVTNDESTLVKPPTSEDKGSVTKQLASTLDFDLEAIKAKYLAERDKRIRPDGNAQYKEFKGQFAHYLTDPYTPRKEREALVIETDFLVLGGGFGGLCLGAELIKAGITDFKMVDKAGDCGGTWYWNRYPGASCDIESYIYMPLLEETGYMPSEKYAKAPELLGHAKRIGEQFGLYERALFHTEVCKMEWDETATRWIVSTDRGDKIRARFVASASGPLNMPKLPGVEGIELFKGHSFHTSRWDYDYTGGDLYGNLDKLGDKRVGFIGTGATAVQAVPHLGAAVEKGDRGKLYVFQRTPSGVGFRGNRPTDPEWVKSLKPGWQEERQENFLKVMAGGQENDLVQDGWTNFSRWLKEQKIPRTPNLWVEYGNLLEIADMQNMQKIRARCDEVVKDKKTADALKPWYRQFCKRPCFHDEFLDTFNLKNVELVDTEGKGIDYITEKGITANGKEYELDCIIYGTGFEVGTSYARRANYETYGRNGRTMTDKWNDGVRTLHGFWMHDFPNLFLITTLQSGYAANFSHMLGRQAKHIAWVVAECKRRDIKMIEASQEAEDAWGETILKNQRQMGNYQKECTPGYYNMEGHINTEVRWQRSASYGQGPLAFCKIMEEWRAKCDMEGLDCTIDPGAWKKDDSIANGNSNGSARA